MYLFVFENVLSDYYHGIAVIAAKSCSRAIEIAVDEFGGQHKTLREKYRTEFLNGTVKQFKVSGVKEEGVISYVHGC